MGHHEIKARQKHLLWHSMWSTIIFEKNFFCTRWTLLTHFCTRLFGLPRAACRNPGPQRCTAAWDKVGTDPQVGGLAT